MLSLTCKTAIKAVIYLASKFESGEKAGIREIADFINASERTDDAVSSFIKRFNYKRVVSWLKRWQRDSGT